LLKRLAMEPPFRVLARALLGLLPVSARTRAVWELSTRPWYMLGVYEAARQARIEGVDAICVIEFGVAGGEGLLALEDAAEAVEKDSGVRIQVIGFDCGASGLPEFCGDHRDHPDFWKPGDFRMDADALRRRLGSRTQLIIGNVGETLPEFVERQMEFPVGFASYDLDLYSSTAQALLLLEHPARKMLKNVPLYFDDIDFLVNHRYAGELLAIDEFNERNPSVKIDRWYGVKYGRPFPERHFLDKMFVAHDLAAITESALKRDNVDLPIR